VSVISSYGRACLVGHEGERLAWEKHGKFFIFLSF
jgi:hypothetical protein